jgi:HAD superfamily hydrolase (TIGR01509 family)
MTDTQIGVLHEIDLVVFDAFGTLVEITDQRRPFAPLTRQMAPEKVARFRQMAMTTGLTLSELDAEIEGGATIGDIVVSQAAIAREVASTALRAGVREMLAGLPIQYGLCSNLSPDYVPALARFPEIKPAFRILSCQVGCMKPDPAIYDLVINTAGVPACRILFVGDTPAADIDGPTRAGMRAMHIDKMLALFVGGNADQDMRPHRERRDDFPTAFRAARGTISTDLDIES